MKGFGLLEAMISLAVMSIIWFGMMAQTTLGARSSKTNTLNWEWNQLVWSVTNTLQNVGLCSTALNGKIIGPISYADPSGFTIAAGSVYQDWKITRVDLVSGAIVNPGQQYVNVFIQGNKIGAYTGAPTNNATVQNIRVNYSAAVTGCW